MATITLRAAKGSPLTNEEVDSNFTNLNTELAGKASTSALDSYQPLLDYTPANKAGDTFTGNVGIGVTPSPWVYGGSILELTNNGVVATAGPNAGFFTNSYYDGSSFVRKTANPAMYYSLQSGTHLWGVAATGAAGSTISFTQVMTLDAGGNLAVGTSSALSKFTLEQSGDTFESGITVSRAGANRATVFLNASNDTLNFGRGGSTAMSIGASGQLGIGGANYGTSGQVLTSQGPDAAPIWQASAAASGDVVGPASATDNSIARFDTTTGKLIQNSGVSIDDSNNVTIPGNLTSTGLSSQIGASSSSATYIFGGGATASGNTKAVSLGTNGASGSTTNITIGSTTAGAATNTLLNGGVGSNVVALAGTSINCTSGNYFTKTATGPLNWYVTNVPTGRVYSFVLELTNGGSGVQTWFVGATWPGGMAPTLTASGVDVLGFITDDGGTTWRGVLLMKDSK